MREDLNIPKYRALSKQTGKYIIGNIRVSTNKDTKEEKYYIESDWIIFSDENRCDWIEHQKIDPSTLAINFPNMLDSKNNPIFASLSEDGKGGDLVEGKCRDINDDKLIGHHAPLKFKGLVRFYNETAMSVVIETKTEIVASTKDWSTPLVKRQGEALRWSDCRQDIKVIGIQK